MRITPKDIARSLIDAFGASSDSVEDLCDGAISLLKRTSPGMPLRMFAKTIDREIRRRKIGSSALLVVPSPHDLSAHAMTPLLEAKTGKAMHVDRAVEPELIGGAVLLVDHRRIDCSIQGALAALLRDCLQPLD